jgi:hypothetical protein
MQWGVSIIQSERGLRVIVPPISSWRQLHKGYFFGGAILAFYTAMGCLVFIRDREPAAIPSMIFCVGGFITVVLMAFYRLHRRLIFDISPETVSVSRIGPFMSGVHRSWPRADVIEIKHNRSNSDRILIRVKNADLVEIFVTPRRELAQWLGQTLSDALQSTPVTVVTQRHLAQPAISVGSRNVLQAIAIAMGAAGLITCLLPAPWFSIGMFLLMLASVPAGLAVGTQDKDFYL